MTTDLKVSIITPVKNRCSYLRGCLDSVANQTYENCEHIVVDGKSTDGTLELLQRTADQRRSRLLFMSREDNSPGEAWNRGLEICSADIIGWLGADDRLASPNVVEKVVQAFRTNNQSDGIYGRCLFLDPDGDRVGVSRFESFSRKALLNRGNHVPMTSLFIRKSLLEQVGGVDSYGNDFEWLLRLSSAGEILALNEIWSHFTLATDSETGDVRKYLSVLEKDWRVSREYGGYFFNSYHSRLLAFKIFSSLFGFNGLAKLKQLSRRFRFAFYKA